MKLIIKILPLGLLTPMFALAQPNLGWFESLLDQFGGLVSTMIPIAIAIGLLVFIWGLVQYIMNSGDDTAKTDGKNKMIYGIVALFVMVSVWGIVAVLGQIFNVTVGGDMTNTPGVDLN